MNDSRAGHELEDRLLAGRLLAEHRQRREIIDDLAAFDPWRKVMGGVDCIFCGVHATWPSGDAHRAGCLSLRARRASDAAKRS